MCALSQRQSALGEGKALVRPEASPSPWRDPFSRGSLSRPRQAREPLQAWSAWSLVKFLRRCSGPWQAGPWYPGFHCADRLNSINIAKNAPLTLEETMNELLNYPEYLLPFMSHLMASKEEVSKTEQIGRA